MIHRIIICLGLLLPALVRADPAKVHCASRDYPNVPGENAISLVHGPKGYSLEIKRYSSKDLKKQGLKCQFHPPEMLLLRCTIGDSWLLEAKRHNDQKLDESGKLATEDLLTFELIKSPLGEPTTVAELSFAPQSCKAEP